MTEVSPHLFIGTITDITHMAETGWPMPTVNLSSSFHYATHGGRLTAASHCYLICEARPEFLSVNWVDADDPKYFDYEGRGVWACERILDFLDRNLGKDRLIVCDKGLSRSPSIAMLYMAKRDLFKLVDDSYSVCREAFTNQSYPNFNPGRGISEFLESHWEDIR